MSRSKPRNTASQATQDEATRARAAVQDVNRKQREARVVELRVQGWSFARIAKEVGYSEQGGAYKAWKRALANIPKAAAEEQREHLRLQLEDVSASLFRKILKGDTRAAEVLVKVQERYCKMLGLDVQPEAAASAPIVVELPAPLSAAIRGEMTTYAS